ncbi:MAG TPA: sulfotransferase [Bryobacteraceae bacterium]|nr:sulfotransferase [Bryobacteraceae bacterium]
MCGLARPPIFIVGWPRSGTTLLRNLLRSHPNLTFPPESQFIPTYYRAYGDPGNRADAIRLGKIILSTRSIRTWRIDLEPAAFCGCRTFREVLCLLFGTWAKQEKKTRWGDKTPQYVTDIPLLRELFPTAQILHIIRDGRDAAVSALRVAFEGNLATAALRWKASVRAGRQAGAAQSAGAYLEVRYESLLQDPEAVMKQICTFLGEPYDPAVLKPSPPRPHALSGAPWINGDPPDGDRVIVRSNAGKWQAMMRPSDRVLFESLAGELLQELGYGTEGKTRPVRALERWFWRLHHCFRYAIARVGVVGRPDLIRTYLRFQCAGLWGRLRAGHSL